MTSVYSETTTTDTTIDEMVVVNIVVDEQMNQIEPLTVTEPQTVGVSVVATQKRLRT